MKLSFDIVLHEEGERGSVYSFRLEGEEKTELEWFLEEDDCRSNPDFRELSKRLLKKGPHEKGFRENWFNPERKVQALTAPYPSGEPWTPTSPVLRLYCTRFQDALIFGYGGVKETQRFQDDEELNLSVEQMEHVDERLQARLRIGDIWIERSCLLRGNLTFHKDDVL